MGNATVAKFLVLNGPVALGALFSGPSASPHPQPRKLVFYAAFHNGNRYSTPSDPFSYWSERGDITPWDNKSTKGQEVRLTPATFGLTRSPSTICLRLTMPHPSPGPEEKLGGQEQQHEPAPFRSKDPSEPLSFTSRVEPAIERNPSLGWLC